MRRFHYLIPLLACFGHTATDRGLPTAQVVIASPVHAPLVTHLQSGMYELPLTQLVCTCALSLLCMPLGVYSIYRCSMSIVQARLASRAPLALLPQLRAH